MKRKEVIQLNIELSARDLLVKKLIGLYFCNPKIYYERKNMNPISIDDLISNVEKEQISRCEYIPYLMKKIAKQSAEILCCSRLSAFHKKTTDTEIPLCEILTGTAPMEKKYMDIIGIAMHLSRVQIKETTNLAKMKSVLFCLSNLGDFTKKRCLRKETYDNNN